MKMQPPDCHFIIPVFLNLMAPRLLNSQTKVIRSIVCYLGSGDLNAMKRVNVGYRPLNDDHNFALI
jgi:hypothetical protein